jgi:acyl-CoA dehydrogenase
MYLSSATLKRYEADGRPQADAPLMHWSIWDAMFKAQNAFEGVISNYPSKLAAFILHQAIFPMGRPYVVPSDRLGGEVARLLVEPSATRDRLTSGMYIPHDEKDAIGVIELALEAVIKAEQVEAGIRAAQKAGRIAGRNADELARAALEKGVITSEELALMQRASRLRQEVIRVDDFPQDFSVEQKQPVRHPAGLPAGRRAAA